MPTAQTKEYATLLRRQGLKATPQRLQLISLLGQMKRPVSAPEIKEKWRGEEIDTVTLYRALDALVEALIARRVDLQHGHADYELIVPGEHHHHLVCTGCGTVEDFSDELCDSLAKKVVKKSNSFKTISSHSMELFGVCASCS